MEECMLTKREKAAINETCTCADSLMTWRARCEEPGRYAAAVYRVPDLTPDERRLLRAFLEIQLSILQEHDPDTQQAVNDA
jgi:hypothetical protein